MNQSTSSNTAPPVAAPRDRQAISARYAALPVEKRSQFRARLAELNMEASQLPAVPLLVRAADGSARGPLSAMQQQLWFLARLDGNSSAYHMTGGLRLDGALSRERLLAGIAGLAQRHDTLRTRILEEQGAPVQAIDAFDPAAAQALCEFHDLRDASGTAPSGALEGLAEAFYLRRFDLEQGPLWRLALVTVGEQRHVLLLTLHHVIADGFSMAVLVREFAKGYSGQQPAAPLAVQFADWVQWQADWQSPAAHAADLAYWRDRLAEPLDPLALPLDRPRTELRNGHGARTLHRLPTESLAGLRALAKAQRSTLSAILLAVYQLVLSRHSGQPTVRVGMPLANRDRSETAPLIGCLVNTVVIEAQLAGALPFTALLQQVQQRLGEAMAHGGVSFADLVQALRPTPAPGVTPLCQALFNLLEVQGTGLPQLPGVQVTEWSPAHPVARYDLSLDIRDQGDALTFAFIYATDIFNADTVQRLADDYFCLLEQVTLDSQAPLGRLALAGPAPVAHQLPSAPFVSLADRLFKQARKQPDSTAVVAGDVALSYQQLSTAAQGLAARLQAQGVKAGECVGVCVERSAALPTALYGVLASGAAYVPLDPDYPLDRLQYILADAGITRVVVDQACQQRHQALFNGLACVTVEQAGQSTALNPVHSHPDQLAYVIYTSGSTGQPKGVAVTQRNVARLLDVTLAPFAFNEKDVWSCFHSYAFDFSVWELFGALSSGGQAVIVPYWAARSAEQFHALVHATGVTVLNQTPSAFLPLIQAEQDLRAPLHSLRCVIFGGEKLEPQALAQWLAWRGETAPRLVNMYGITETTVHVTARDITLADTLGHAPSLIGKPLADLQLYVLDADLNPAPLGTVGELCVGGAGLARGYLGQPALTASRFVADPFGPSGARLYRSGDLARRLPSGELEYLGRNDAQVKIRGFRIEPGEISAQLREHPQVRAAVVVARPNGQGDLRLVAYLVAAPGGAPLDTTSLQAYLASRLPAHMVPSAFVWLEALPLTANGKLDTKALPDPQAQQAERPFLPPEGPYEEVLAAIWQDVLGDVTVGRDDNFFELGGHSLSAVKVTTRVRERLHLTLPLQQVFNLPTLRQFAAALADLQAGVSDVAPANTLRPRAQRDGFDPAQPLPVSQAQARLWVLWQLEPESSAYHVPGAVRLHGEVNAQRIRQAFTQMVARHEALRTTFHLVDGQPCQRVGLDTGFQWHTATFDATSPGALNEALREQVSRPFNLAQGPLLRVSLLSSSPTEHVLAVVMHHIIADGWSMNLLIDEFCAGHEALRQGMSAQWPALPIQCADHALWERSQQAQQAADLHWWQATLGDEQPVLELPLARPRPAVRDGAGARYVHTLSPEHTRALRHLAQGAGTTLFSTLLAAYQALLHRYSGQADLRIGIPVANREQLEVESLIGFFTNTLVIRAQVHGQQPFATLLGQTRTQVLDAQAHASVPFAQLVDALQPQRELGLSPLFQTMFNLQVTPPGQFATLGGLRVSTFESPAMGGETAPFDLTLDVTDRGDTLRLSFGYATDVLEPSTIEAMADHYVSLLSQVVAQPTRAIGSLVLGTPVAPRAASRPYHGVLARFAEQAGANAQACALRSPDTPHYATVSYGELAHDAGRVAARLMAANSPAEARIGLCVSRSPAMVAALLGIWRAGGAFVPLDPHYPPERLAHIVADAGIEQVVVDRASATLLSTVLKGLTLHVLEDDDHTAPVSLDGQAPASTALAYVMYTSGSTGAPKGVAMTHGALSVHMEDVFARFALNAQDRVLQFSTINFDAALEQLLPALCVGARVVLRGPELWSWPEFNAVLAEEAVTVADLPTAFWQQWLGDLPAALPALRLVTVGGEALTGQALARWRASGLCNVRFENTYGPTEAAISAMSRHTRAADSLEAMVTLGTAYPGRSVHVLDAWGNRVPDGATGELCIGGDGLARGYLGRPAATAERFVPDPFGLPGARLYRTGDLCRVRPGQQAEPVIDYLGRGDRQVKLRGYRIELADVESAVGALPGVRDAVAQVRGEGEARRLYAWAVVGNEAITGAQLLAQLADRLPTYLMPTAVVPLSSLPLTPNGKVDKAALPLPTLSPVEDQRERLAARNEREASLLATWREVLGRDDISIDDNFFALGGDSIQAIQVISRARANGLTLSVRDLFAHQTVAALAEQVPHASTAVRYQAVEGPVPLTPIQHWFFSEHPEGANHWNQSVLLAADQALAVAPLRQALDAVMQRHDALRLRYQRDADGQWQAACLPVTIPAQVLEQVDLSQDEEPAAALNALGDEVQASLDIQNGPLWRAVLATLPGGASRLLLVVHHLAVDGVSWRILLEELAQAWAQAQAGTPIALPAQSLSWGQWAQALQAHGQSPAVREELPRWQRQLTPTRHWTAEQRARGGLPLAAAPRDVNRTLAASQVLRWQLDQPHTQALLHQATGTWQCRVDELLLAALAQALAGWGATAGVLLELEGHGREEVIDGLDLTRTVGWFTTRYPLWLACDTALAQTLAQVRQSLRGLPHKGMHYGVLETLSDASTQAAIAALPRAQVSFNYLGQFGQGEQGGPLRLATGEQAGAALGPHTLCSYALEMNALIVDGCLSVDWRYLPGLIAPAQASALSAQFQELLRTLLVPPQAQPGAFASDVQGDDLEALLGSMDD